MFFFNEKYMSYASFSLLLIITDQIDIGIRSPSVSPTSTDGDRMSVREKKRMK